MNRLSLFLVSLALLVPGIPAAAPEPPPDKKPWDVSAPLGPTVPLSFDATEGTWINLDISPDGTEVAFDLLGDLYVMPLAGGAARRLTSGAAFDMQPCYSPDGRRLAFTSDRDGLDNLWVMDRDGRNPRQVSHERDRAVNSPAWTRDGQSVLGRKHFVKERSIGAGEIWQYHLHGGDGLQVTDKHGWQKDAGEPALSPDGRTLYYSRDVSPGETFEYNRDPNGTIYAIHARDLWTGDDRLVTGPAGGAAAPRPSPDGRLLAFVRRVRDKTVLHLRDLATGAEWPVYDGLERDMQETWAIHGVYPRYAFTPDGRSIVVWAGGQLWRVDLASRRTTPIPLRAHVEQLVHQALRFPRPVQAHAERFPVRLVRHVSLSRDGRQVAYSALSHIYVKRLPDGPPRRLTGDARLEAFPTFSPDGRWIAYVTWSDAEAGRLRLAPVGGGAGRDLVAAPGHYVEPAFSPDGRRVAYRLTDGDDIRGRAFTAQPGVYVVDVAGGPPRLVGADWPERQRAAVRRPRWSRAGDRLYLQQSRDDKQVLLSVRLDGGGEIVHLRAEAATELVPSPDERWVAFAERFHTYVAPFLRTGRPIDLSATTKAVPVKQLSREAGQGLGWTFDSAAVTFPLGPDLYVRPVGDLAPAKEPPEAPPLPLGFDAPADVPTGDVALVGARVVPMTGDAVIEHGTVLIHHNRIAAVGPVDQVVVPAGAQRIDVTGKTILPGLIDVHAHVRAEEDGLLSEVNWPLLANLAFGVTTVHDPSNDTATVFTSAEMIRAGARLGPRVFSTGTILYGAELPIKTVIESYDDALSHLRRLRAAGAFTVKSYNQPRRDARQMIIKAARSLGMQVVPEGGSLLYFDETLIQDGHTGIEHALPVPVLYQDVVQLMRAGGVGYTPTLIVGYGGLFGENYWYQHSDAWRHARLLRFTPREVVDSRARRRLMAPDEDWNHLAISREARKFLRAGGSVQLGAHGQLQGLGAHWELWMLGQGGMTPLEALRCATLNGARYLGLDGDLGSLAPGKLADLIVLDRDPLVDLRHSDSVQLVMVNGRLYRADTLAETVTGARPAPILPWQWEQQRHAAPARPRQM